MLIFDEKMSGNPDFSAVPTSLYTDNGLSTVSTQPRQSPLSWVIKMARDQWKIDLPLIREGKFGGRV